MILNYAFTHGYISHELSYFIDFVHYIYNSLLDIDIYMNKE